MTEMIKSSREDLVRSTALAMALCPFAMTMAPSGHAWAAETWLADPISECRVWTPEVNKGDIVSWSGACADGRASGAGVLVWINGSKLVARYVGTMADGKADGYKSTETGPARLMSPCPITVTTPGWP